MIDIGMYVALGFLVASLLALMLVPPLWNRAVRLTTRRIESTMPLSMTDIQADKDQQRAEFAIELRRVEVALEKAKDKATRELVESNRRRVEVAEIKIELEAAKGRLQEKENANRVLEQTIRRRLPELEGRLKAARDTIAQLETANTDLRQTATTQGESLKVARTTLNNQRGDIDQLRGALGYETTSHRSAKSDSALAKENRRLSAELSKLRQDMVDGELGSRENEMLRLELDKLASQILAVAGADTMPLPEAPTPQIYEPAIEPPSVAMQPMPDLVARREEALSDFAADEPEAPAEAFPAAHPEVPVAAAPQSESPAVSEEAHEGAAKGRVEEADEAPEPRSSLGRMLASRKAKRGRRGSLSERLKGVSAESPDL